MSKKLHKLEKLHKKLKKKLGKERNKKSTAKKITMHKGKDGCTCCSSCGCASYDTIYARVLKDFIEESVMEIHCCNSCSALFRAPKQFSK